MEAGEEENKEKVVVSWSWTKEVDVEENEEKVVVVE